MKVDLSSQEGNEGRFPTGCNPSLTGKGSHSESFFAALPTEESPKVEPLPASPGRRGENGNPSFSSPERGGVFSLPACDGSRNSRFKTKPRYPILLPQF